MIFSVTLPSDGTNADVRDYNDPIQQIIAGLNGQLNDDNISGLSGSKITSGTLPETALTDALKTGWYTQSTLPTSIVALGNRSYTVTYGSSVAAYKSPGMRNRFTRNTAAPNQSASLNGTTQYFVKTSPNKMTWTDDWAIGVWVKLSAYPAAGMSILSRYNGTSGWDMSVDASGRVIMYGYNGSASNLSGCFSTAALPLNKWVHVGIQVDMSSFSSSATTSYVMLDGVNVPISVFRAGTNPTSLVQAGNLEIGSRNGGLLPFRGKIAQVAIYNAKITQATMLASMNQGLTGSETNLASGYSLSNSVLDLNTTTPNDLSVGGGSATTTNADSPFGDSGVSTTFEYGITMAVASNGLSETIQVPEGCALPTTGSISAMAYSGIDTPFNFPKQTRKWTITALYLALLEQTSAVNGTWHNPGSASITVPIGEWSGYYSGNPLVANGTNNPSLFTTLSTTNNSETIREFTMYPIFNSTTNHSDVSSVSGENDVSTTTATPYYLLLKTDQAGSPTTRLNAAGTAAIIKMRNAYL